VTTNIFRPSSGGQGQNGEATQADKLTFVAQLDRVKVVVLSIGGNDLGFADIIRACAQAYATRTGPCNPSQQQTVNARHSAAFAGVAKAIDEVRAVMADRGLPRQGLALHPAELRLPGPARERGALRRAGPAARGQRRLSRSTTPT
jgi:hypothetical protein